MMKTDNGEWVCGSCGFRKSVENAEEYTTTEDQEHSEIIESSKVSTLPTTDALCSECGNSKAYWYMQQTRSADESETRFFVCTDCEHKWREDDN